MSDFNDFNDCRRCGTITGLTSDLRCATCGENICLVCGCTESRACIDGTTGLPCGWARPGVCTVCIGSVDAQGNPNGAQIGEMAGENRNDLQGKNLL